MLIHNLRILAILKPFKGVRPNKDFVRKIASRPYDVLNTEEARKESEGNPFSFLRIVKPEIDFKPGFDPHSPEVYQKGRDNFFKAQQSGLFLFFLASHSSNVIKISRSFAPLAGPTIPARSI